MRVSFASMLLVACGGGGGNRADAGDAAVATDGPDSALGHPDAQDATAGRDDGPPISAHDLTGSWYSLAVAASDGGLSDVYRRLRFDGNQYYLVENTRNSHCVEVGTFAVVDASLRLTISYAQGIGRCVEGTERIEKLARTEKGFSLGYPGTVFSYVPIRTTVPKLFATIEYHDGNLMGDVSIPGSNAVEKADSICNTSIAKPDGQAYRALFTDGVHRTATPAKDWVLRPLTTYFRADGAVNVFTTDADALADVRPHHALLPGAPSGPGFGIWTGFDSAFAVGGTCSGWTSASPLVTGGTGNGLDYAAEVGCHRREMTFLCVSEGEPGGQTGADGGVEGGSGTPNADELALQGTWIGRPPAGAPTAGVRPMLPIGPRRLRIEGKQYSLVWAGVNNYCGEIGTLEATSTNIRFQPQRIEGFGSCQLDVERDEALAWNGAEFSLSRDAEPVRFTAVPPGVAPIFATFEIHNGNFAGDPKLPGANAIAKADVFCNQSAARPDRNSYKALLVDGANRSAIPGLDWVLKPFTTYHQAIEMTPLVTTNASGFFDQELARAPIVPGAEIAYAWTGLNFGGAVDSDTCMGWTSNVDTERARVALLRSSALASSVFVNCATRQPVLCAAQ